MFTTSHSNKQYGIMLMAVLIFELNNVNENFFGERGGGERREKGGRGEETERDTCIGLNASLTEFCSCRRSHSRL